MSQLQKRLSPNLRLEWKLLDQEKASAMEFLSLCEKMIKVGEFLLAHDVARAGRLEHAEEGPVAPVLRVQLDDLLVVVRPLQQLDARIEGPAVRVEQHLG